MSVLIESTPPLVPPLQAEGEIEIGVFTAKGLCVGASVFASPTPTGETIPPEAINEIASPRSGRGSQRRDSIGLAVWADDPTTPEIDGAAEGEALSFRLWDGQAETSVLPMWEGEDRHSCLSFVTDGFAMGEFNHEETKSTKIPRDYVLYEAFPNPFNSMTTIRYDLPLAGEVTLTIMDLNGREIALLADGNTVAGSHSVTWNASNQPSGAYLLKLSTSLGTRTQKVTLVK